MSDVLPYVLHGMFNREISLWYTILTPEKVCSAVIKIKKAMSDIKISIGRNLASNLRHISTRDSTRVTHRAYITLIVH